MEALQGERHGFSDPVPGKHHRRGVFLDGIPNLLLLRGVPGQTELFLLRIRLVSEDFLAEFDGGSAREVLQIAGVVVQNLEELLFFPVERVRSGDELRISLLRGLVKGPKVIADPFFDEFSNA
jgi:hypothetical protein